jgi:hypothetical protein
VIATRWLTRPGPESEAAEPPTEAEKPASAADDSPSWLRPSLVFWTSTLAIAAAAMIRSGYLFTRPIHEQGDDALNSLLAGRAEHFELLIGNYSRVGFHHPGPALLYMLGGGSAFFHGLLHVAPTPYNGELLGAITFAAALIGLAVLAVYRCTRSVAASVVLATICFAFAANHAMFGDSWFPYLYMAPFLLFVVAGAAVAAGYTVELPSFLLAAGVLAHGHVSFLMFVGVTAVAVAAGWVVRHRREWRAELGAHRRATFGGLALVALFLLPVILELVLHYPGPWQAYRDYVSHPNPPRDAGDVARFFRWYWSDATLPVALTVIAAVVAGTLMIIDRRRIFGFLYAMLALQSILFLVYIARGVDVLDAHNRYVGFFYLTVPLLLVAAASAHLAMWLAQWLAQRLSARGEHWRYAVGGAAVATAVAVLVAGAVATQHARDRYRALPDYPRLVTALDRAPDRHGRVAAFDFAHDRWPEAAGIGVAAQRQHVPWCISNARWTNLFTGNYICKASYHQWTLAIVLSNEIPRSAAVIWRDDKIAVIERDPAAPPLPAYAQPPVTASLRAPRRG